MLEYQIKKILEINGKIIVKTKDINRLDELMSEILHGKGQYKDLTDYLYNL